MDLDELSFRSDLQCSKSCSQTSCRRVADQAAHLVDALVIFKTWMIQTQVANRTQQQHASDGSHLQEAAAVSCQSLQTALRRAERAEDAVQRMRAGCMAMRRQVEVGLGYRREIERLRSEVQMCQRTIANYQSVINEGAEFRNDLKAELERARKAASVARAQLANELRRRTSSISSSAATTAVPDFAYPLSPTSQHDLRAECDRLHKWLTSVREENQRLEATLVAKTSQEIGLGEKLDRVKQLVSSQLAQLRKRQRSRRRRRGDGGQRIERAPSPTGLSWLREVALLVGVSEEKVSALIKPSLTSAATVAVPVVTASSPCPSHRLTRHSAALESVLNDLSTTVSDISDDPDDADADGNSTNQMLPPPAPAATAPVSRSRLPPPSKPHSLSDDDDSGESWPELRRRKRRLHEDGRSTGGGGGTKAAVPSTTVSSSPVRDSGGKRRCRRPAAAFVADKSEEGKRAGDRIRGSLQWPPPSPPPPRRGRRRRLDSTASAVSCLSAVTSVMLENLSLTGLQKVDDSDLSFVVDEVPNTTATRRTRSQRRVFRGGSKQVIEEEEVSPTVVAIKPATPKASAQEDRGRSRLTARKSCSRLAGKHSKAVDLDASPQRARLSTKQPSTVSATKDAEPSDRRRLTRLSSRRQRGSPPSVENDIASDVSSSPPVLRPSTSPESNRSPPLPHPVSAKQLPAPAVRAPPFSRLPAARKASKMDLDLEADLPAGRVISHPRVCRGRQQQQQQRDTPSATTPKPSPPSEVISQMLNAHYPAGVADWFNLLTSDDLTSTLLMRRANEEVESPAVEVQKGSSTTTTPSQSQVDQMSGRPTAEASNPVDSEDHPVSVVPTLASPPESPPHLQRPQVIDSKSLSAVDNQQPTAPHPNTTSCTSVHLSLSTVSSPHSLPPPPPLGSIPKGSFMAPHPAEEPEEAVDQEIDIQEAVLHYLVSSASTVASAPTEDALGMRLRQLAPSTGAGTATVLSALLRLRTGPARETGLPDVTTVPESERRAARLLIASPALAPSVSAILQPSCFLTWLAKQRSSLSLCQFFRLAQSAFLACPPHAIPGLVYSAALLVNGATGWVLKPPLPVTCLLVAADSAVPGLWRQRRRSGSVEEYCDPLAVTADVRFGGRADRLTASALQLSSLQHVLAVEVATCGSQSGALSRPLIRRLVATGWLPRDSDAAAATTAAADAPARLVLGVEVQRTRDFLLFLVDECLGVQRAHRGQALNADTPPRSPNAEAGLALRLVLSLVAFTDLGDDDGKQKPTNSRQRMLKNRDAKSLRFGTLGWLLSGRLLPWLKSLTASKTPCPVVERRLAVLCTDVLLLGVQLDLARTTGGRGGGGHRANRSADSFQRGLAACAERLCNLLLRPCVEPQASSFHPEQLFCLLRLLPTRPSAICEALEQHPVVTAIDAAWLSRWEPQHPPSLTSYPTARAVDLLRPLLTQPSSCLDLPTDSRLSHLLDSCRLTLRTTASPKHP